MRVIGGTFRSRVLQAPAGNATRPTSDRLRETLFNVLAVRVPGSRFADLFAGSGAVGIEALSRGAAHSLFVERAAPALAALRRNLANLDLAGQSTVDPHAVARVLSAAPDGQPPFDLLFLDPPYEAAEAYDATLRVLGREDCPWRAPGALDVAEHARRAVLGSRFGVLERTRLLEQGDAALSFFAVADAPPA